MYRKSWLIGISLLFCLNCGAQKFGDEWFSFRWNGSTIYLPSVEGYSRYDDSRLGSGGRPISDFTLTGMQPMQVNDFELMVRNGSDIGPFIHAYTFEALRGSVVGREEFAGYRDFWREGLESQLFNHLAAKLLTSGSVKRLWPTLPAIVQDDYFIVYDNDRQLSYVFGIGDGDERLAILYTNILLIDGNILFIKGWIYGGNNMQIYEEMIRTVNSYVASVIGRN